MDTVSALQHCVKGRKFDMQGNSLNEVADAICFMMRVLHFFAELFGPDLGPKIVPPISTIVQLAIVCRNLPLCRLPNKLS